MQCPSVPAAQKLWTGSSSALANVGSMLNMLVASHPFTINDPEPDVAQGSWVPGYAWCLGFGLAAEMPAARYHNNPDVAQGSLVLGPWVGSVQKIAARA